MGATDAGAELKRALRVSFVSFGFEQRRDGAAAALAQRRQRRLPVAGDPGA